MQNIKLVAIDIGGSLINDNNQIPKNNIDTLKNLKRMGIKVVLITARMYSSTKYISSLIEADYGVYGNGSNIIDLNGNIVIYSEKLDFDTTLKLIKFGKERGLYVHLNGIFEEISDQEKYFALKHQLLNKKYPLKLKSNIKIIDNLLKNISKDNDYIKVVYVSEFNMDDILKSIREFFSEIFITEYNTNLYESTINKTINYIEIGNKNITKAEGLKILIDKLGLLQNEVLVIGDGNNDVEMFDNFCNSGCLKNGSVLARQHAKYISPYTNNEGGVSDIIKHYVKGLVKE